MIKIVHLADIHIQDRRRNEYEKVFNKLYESLYNDAPSLITIVGDVFDNKMKASPHNLEDVTTFLTNLTKIAPVILIAGNHDTNCLTPGSLDLLSPLINDHNKLQPPALIYWRESGVYFAHGIIWTVIATDGDKPSAILEEQFLKDYPNSPHICLFHEEVNGALLSNGVYMRDFKLTTSSFDSYDLSLGGHIHLRQNFTARAAYCGSLIQQNIGESHNGHGYILWEIEESNNFKPYRTALPKMQMTDIYNEFGFIRVNIDDLGNNITKQPIPLYPLYWELIHSEQTPQDLIDEHIQKFTELFKMKHRVIRIRAQDKENDVEGEAKKNGEESAEKIALMNAQIASRSIDAHEIIIRELLESQYPEFIQDVLNLHRERWVPPRYSGGKFRILKLEFDNAYAFGPANIVDFTRLENCVSGVISPNHTGKSSLIEALLFALYESRPRAVGSKKDIIHKGASSCRFILDFELDNKIGRIEKAFDTAHASAKVNYRFKYNGEERTKGGVVETLAEIESVIGNAISALSSSFQLQGSDTHGFIGSSPSERKKLLASVLSLGSFESLERSTIKELTSYSGEVRSLAGQYRGYTQEELKQKIATEELISSESDNQINVVNDLILAQQKVLSAVALEVSFISNEKSVLVAQLRDYSEAINKNKTISPKINLTICQQFCQLWLAYIEPITESESQILKFDESKFDESKFDESIIIQLQDSTFSKLKVSADDVAKSDINLTNITSKVISARDNVDRIKTDLLKFCTINIRTCHNSKDAAQKVINLQKKITELCTSANSNVDIIYKLPPVQVQKSMTVESKELYSKCQQITNKARSGKVNIEFLSTLLKRARPEPTAEQYQLSAQWNIQQCQKYTSDYEKILRFEKSSDVTLSLQEYKIAVEISSKSYADAKSKLDKYSAILVSQPQVSQPQVSQPQVSQPQITEETAIENVRLTKEWYVATKHINSFASKLQPVKNCPGCSHASSIFANNAHKNAATSLQIAESAYNNIINHAYQNAVIEVAATETKMKDDVRILKIMEIKTELIGKISKSEEFKNANSICSKYDESIAMVEAYNYWYEKEHDDISKQHKQYDIDYKNWEYDLKEFQDKIKSDTAKQILEIEKNLQSAQSEILVWEKYDEQVQKLQDATTEFEKINLVAINAQENYIKLKNLRSKYVNSYFAWEAYKANVIKQQELLDKIKQTEEKITKLKEAFRIATDKHYNVEHAYNENVQKLMAVQKKQSAAVREFTRLTTELSYESERYQKYTLAVKQQEVLRLYRTVLRSNGGIGDILLGKGRARVERQINNSLCELGAKFVVQVNDDYEIFQKNSTDNYYLPASLCSGYQKFVLNLAARLAIWHLSTSARPDAFIIDEGFGACDDEYLDSMANSLEALASTPNGPRLIFIVSHVDVLKARVERALEIKVYPTGSRVVNTTAPINNIEVAPINNIEVAPINNIEVFRPDLLKVGHIYCNICKSSIQAGRREKHIVSKKHTSAFIKFNK